MKAQTNKWSFTKVMTLPKRLVLIPISILTVWGSYEISVRFFEWIFKILLDYYL